MTATEHVILVDKNDKPIGTAEKLEAHQKNWMHRAFSIFIFKRDKEEITLLLQQRAAKKYHSAGLWTNTCCSHPRPGENIIAAGERRLKEEMGFETNLESAGYFHYIAHFENGLVENEIDHVLVGFIDDIVFKPDPAEVQAFRWVTFENLSRELRSHPQQFTAWFQEAWEIANKLLACSAYPEKNLPPK